jgi:hypothetical protein
MTELTPHFTLEEFTYSATAQANGLDNQPPPELLDDLELLAYTMEAVRLLLGRHPITITSGYRGPQLNAAVGGATNSAHCAGLACDFICPGYGTPYAICLKLMPYLSRLGIDQLIYEAGVDGEGDEWVHLGLAAQPRHQMLTISSAGTFEGLKNVV